MRAVNEYIVSLLYHHDCVILPGLGGFVARHVPSGTDLNRELILPPCKNILFNKNLINNDGLLCNYVVEQAQCSYPEAVKIVEEYVQELKKTLTQKHRFEIEHLGALYYDHENNVQFQALADINYLIDSFGLVPVKARPLIQIAAEIKTLETNDRVVKQPQKLVIQKSKIKQWAIAAVSIPIVATAFYLSFTNQKIKNAWEAAITPFRSSQTFAYSPKNYTDKDYYYHYTRPTEVHPDINGYGSFKLNSEGKFFWVNIADTISVQDKTQVIKNLPSFEKSKDSTARYQIVMGCFAVHDNAERLIRQLSGRNIQAFISGQNKNGLYVVSAGSFNAIEEARNYLSQVRQNYPSAWLMNEN